jgi:carbamoyltransferase
MHGNQLVAACEQERYSLEKHTRQFPHDAIRDCLKIANITIEDVDAIAFGLDHRLYLREFYLKPALEDEARLDFMINDLDRFKQYSQIEQTIREETNYKGKIDFHSHHLCHLASAYYPSGFGEAFLASYDGLGEVWAGFLATGKDGEIDVVNRDNRFPNSLGLIYSALTFFLGWKNHCDEGIVMGLASLGNADAKIIGHEQTYHEFFCELIQETGDYSYQINPELIAYHQERDRWVSDVFKAKLGQPRKPDDPLHDHHQNIAAGLQRRIEEVVLGQMRRARKEFGLNRLALAGGVALNCSLNGKIVQSGIFDEVFVQPASGDAGIAVGACYLSAARLLNGIKPIKNHNFYLGSAFDDSEIENALIEKNCSVQCAEDIFSLTSQKLQEGFIVGWFQGGAEFGPRALGNRSILARPYPAKMKDHINARVKFREAFRPFAPAVLKERSQEYFQLPQESPHMLIACQAQPDKAEEIAAVVHVDGTCRVQTVQDTNNSNLYALLKQFESDTGCPVILNTSFNVKGQPIVNTPQQAIDCFLSTNIDFLVMGSYFLEKEDALGCAE